jgi:hypothetical protein
MPCEVDCQRSFTHAALHVEQRYRDRHKNSSALTCASHPIRIESPDGHKSLLQQRPLFGWGFGFFWGDDYGHGYFVLVFEVEELYALGAAPAARMDLASALSIMHQNQARLQAFRSERRPEILKPGLNQSHNNSKKHRSRNAEHKRSVCCFERSQQLPRRRHNQISVTQGRVVGR